MTGVITATIFSKSPNSTQKVEMDATYELLCIDILKEVNRIPTAEITLIDGDVTKREFEVSNSDFFAPGQEIEIQLRYESSSQNETVFKGIIIKHSVRATLNQSCLNLYLKDAAIKLIQQRKNAVFPKKQDDTITDKQIIEEIIKSNQLQLGEIAETETEHLEMVQFYCTDWDFILSRAEANSLWIIVNDGKISAISPELLETDLRGSVPLKAEYGLTTLYEFEMEANIQDQYSVVQSQAWDIKEQKLSKVIKAKDNYPLQGNLKPKKLATAIGADSFDLIAGSELVPQELQAWADAKMNKTRLSMLRGRVSVPGFAGIKLGDVIEIAGISDRFNGRTRVTGIRHQVSEDGWQTDVQFGLSATWFSQNKDIIDTPASGLVPAINGLQIGIVEQYLEDPQKKLRVRVRVPALANVANTEGGVVWARLAALDAGKERGTFFRPELGDEVVLGFLDDDPRQAIVLGSMYSEKNAVPWTVTEKNNEKGIITRKKLKLFFNDEDDKESIIIETPKGNTIILSDKENEGIQILDQNKNTAIMNSDGIQLISDKDITIKAKGNITLEGKEIDIK
ncbi:type VI secretion system tip protein VgrG [Lusitaniella coriacea]|uniref:type VI secretion system tip protein VgrG n=1 Tax=Lusitaniella coriacea TaxID=1983105 RepID=UPI003CFB5607